MPAANLSSVENTRRGLLWRVFRWTYPKKMNPLRTKLRGAPITAGGIHLRSKLLRGIEPSRLNPMHPEKTFSRGCRKWNFCGGNQATRKLRRRKKDQSVNLKIRKPPFFNPGSQRAIARHRASGP